MPASSILWHTQNLPSVLSTLNVSTQTGLTSEVAAKRLAQYGRNELTAGERISPWKLLLDQLKNILVIILIIAIGLSAILGHEVEAITIGIIVLFAVFLGFIQEYRAERAIEALKKMAAPTATVIRDGKEQTMEAALLVPGDIIFLKAGDKVPADARLLTAINLKVDEAALTGESVPVEKHSEPLSGADLPVGDRKNMVYSGTAATYGRGSAVVTDTGMQTEFGKIAGLLQTVEQSRTPLQENLDKVGQTLAKAAFVIVILISALGYFRGEPLLEIFVFGVALAVAVVPEALPAVVTISLAIGVQKMVKRHALIRRLPAVETLGSTTVICSDKTGTLTKDEMTVRQIFAGGEIVDVLGSGYEPAGTFSINGSPVQPSDDLRSLLRAGALCNDSRLIRTGEGSDIVGDPTEGAIVVAAAKAGLKKEELDVANPRTGEIPFTSETKRMTTVHTVGSDTTAYAKGAPEVLLEQCSTIWKNGAAQPFHTQEKEEVLTVARSMAENALRVLAITMKPLATLQTAEKDMTLLGLVGMIDPPRAEAKDAIAKCNSAGIRVVMITGDHPVTAQAIARELGILTNGKVITGPEFSALDDAMYERTVDDYQVYARVSPAHKLRVVGALQKNGHIVAMTGDGVNDAPALKKADIGIAMGITGTDVTKEAAAMMLTDDNFASIVAAVEEGRGIFGNIKKYLMYLLSSNIGEILIMTIASVLGWPLPLSAVQILYVNLATDGLPALALAVDPPEKDLMKRPPRDPRTGIFTRPVVSLLLASGLASTIINLSVFRWALGSGRSDSEAMSMVFALLVTIEFLKAYSFRSDRHTILKNPFGNKWLNIAIAWELILLALVLYVPFLQTALGTFALSLHDWGIILGSALFILPVIETAKWMARKGWLGRME